MALGNRGKLFSTAVFILLSSQCSVAYSQVNSQPEVAQQRVEEWVSKTMGEMSIDEKVGQVLQIRVYGDYKSFTTPDFLAVREQIDRFHIGSVDLGARMLGPNLIKGSPDQVAGITNELQRASKLPLLVGADIERGLASRLSDVPDFPFPMAFGAETPVAAIPSFFIVF